MFNSASRPCTECLPGSRGADCAEACAPGFYGRLCRERCSCDRCDKVHGCQNVPKDYTHNVSAGIDLYTIIPERVIKALKYCAYFFSIYTTISK